LRIALNVVKWVHAKLEELLRGEDTGPVSEQTENNLQHHQGEKPTSMCMSRIWRVVCGMHLCLKTSGSRR
jgi:hypothetical protein